MNKFTNADESRLIDYAKSNVFYANDTTRHIHSEVKQTDQVLEDKM